MGRPKGSKTQSQLDPKNMIPANKGGNDENENPLPSSAPPVKKPNSTIETRKKTKTTQVWHKRLGPQLEEFPRFKLPQNKTVLRRYLALREKHPKEKLCLLVNILYDEILKKTWIPARIFTVIEGL